MTKYRGDSMKLDPEKEQVVLNNKGNTHGHEAQVNAEPSLEDYLSKNYSTRAAEQFGKLAVGWRRDIQERRRVQQVLNLSRKIRDTRVALKIGLLEVAERTSLDPDMLLLLESGLLPRE